MANVIKIKRSTGSSAPSSLSQGELAYAEGSQKLYIGTDGGAQDVIAGIGNVDLITGQTAETTIDGNADYLLVYDASATAFKKVLTKYVGSLSALGLTATATEINTVADGSTSATPTTVASGDQIPLNDNGTMVQIDVDNLDTYFSGTTNTLSNKTLSSPTITGNTTFSDGAYDFNIASHDGTNGLALAGTIVSSSAAELNKLDGATVTTAEINILDGDTSATATTIADADRLILNDNGTMVQIAVTDLDTYVSGTTSTLTNKTLSSPTITGNTTFSDGAYNFNIASHDGTNGLALAGTVVTSSAAELNSLDGFTGNAADLNFAKDLRATGVTTTELDVLDGITATTAELNIMDGDTSATSTTLADADRVVVNDNGTMKQVALTDFETYFESALDTLSNVTSVGTLNGLTIANSQTIDAGSNTITNVADPVNDQDAATKAYVDAVKTGLDIKDSVRAATTGSNIDLTADLQNGDSIDNVTLATGDRVLVKDQTDSSQNGIYVVVASGTAGRAGDFDENAEVTGGAFTFVEEGDTNADSGWVMTEDGTITVDTSDINFAQFSGAGQITAGDGLTKSGNTINAVGTTNRVTVNADSIDIASTYVGQSSITTLGTIGTGTWNADTVGVAYGGTGLTTFSKGSVVVANSADTLTSLDGGGSNDGILLYTASSDTISWTNEIDGGSF